MPIGAGEAGLSYDRRCPQGSVGKADASVGRHDVARSCRSKFKGLRSEQQLS